MKSIFKHRKNSVYSRVYSLSINKSDSTVNSITTHDCYYNKNCNSINCEKINKVLKIRYLGLIIDKNLKWKLHVNNLIGKLRFITFNMVKLKKNSSKTNNEVSLLCTISIQFSVWFISMGWP